MLTRTPVGIAMKGDGTVYIVTTEANALKVTSFNAISTALPASPTFYESPLDSRRIRPRYKILERLLINKFLR
jgi:hypothetical protein